MKFIQGEKIYLRGIELGDANDAYLQWINDPEVTSGLVTGYFPTTKIELENYIQNVIQKNNAVMFAICENDSKEHVGNIKLDNIDWIARVAEMGLMIGSKSSQGKGIGFESCYLTIKYAFEALNLRKVYLTVFTNNPGAVRLYEKLGFVQEGSMRSHIFKDGEYYDKIVMGIFKDELKK